MSIAKHLIKITDDHLYKTLCSHDCMYIGQKDCTVHFCWLDYEWNYNFEGSLSTLCHVKCFNILQSKILKYDNEKI